MLSFSAIAWFERSTGYSNRYWQNAMLELVKDVFYGLTVSLHVMTKIERLDSDD